MADCEWYPLITYLSRVIACPTADWRTFQLSGGRSLTIELSFSSGFWKNPPFDQVVKWAKMLRDKVQGIQCVFAHGCRVVIYSRQRSSAPTDDSTSREPC